MPSQMYVNYIKPFTMKQLLCPCEALLTTKVTRMRRTIIQYFTLSFSINSVIKLFSQIIERYDSCKIIINHIIIIIVFNSINEVFNEIVSKSTIFKIMFQSLIPISKFIIFFLKLIFFFFQLGCIISNHLVIFNFSFEIFNTNLKSSILLINS